MYNHQIRTLSYESALERYHSAVERLSVERDRIVANHYTNFHIIKNNRKDFQKLRNSNKAHEAVGSYLELVKKTRFDLMDDRVFTVLNESEQNKKFYAIDQCGNGVVMSRKKGASYNVDMTKRTNLSKSSSGGFMKIVGEVVLSAVEGLFKGLVKGLFKDGFDL